MRVVLLVHPLYQKHNKVDDKRQRHYKAYNDNKGLSIHTALSVSPSHTREHKKGSKGICSQERPKKTLVPNTTVAALCCLALMYPVCPKSVVVRVKYSEATKTVHL
jgi:hypothetical protein